MNTDFTLNGRLAAGGYEIARKHGCRILLKDEANFPWFIIVPEVSEGVEDLHQLDVDTFAQVMQAVREVSLFASSRFNPEKLNVACIGNIVRQMHIHVVARFTHDPAWPGVVWACEVKGKYPQAEAEAIVAAAQAFLEVG
ncbi:HIT family protein [Akkermansiaceae bacterium]|nr:HIT family protein [Akkermansiaceae bacterium]